MAKFRSIKNSLISGEISPTADGRTDLPEYAHACKVMKNIIPFPAGGGYMRPGTFYQSQKLFSDFAAPVLIPFTASDDTEWMLACYPLRTGGASAKIVIHHSQATSVTEVFAPSTTLAALPVSPGTLDWTRTDFEQAKWFQIGDVLKIVTNGKEPIQVTMIAPGNFTLATTHGVDALGANLSGTALRDAYPYVEQNTTAFTLTASALTGNITVSMSGNVFALADNGAYVKVDSGGVRGAFKITSAPTQTVPQTFNATVIVNLGAVGPVATFWAPAWSNARGWPGTIEMYRNRIAYGGNDFLPDSIWWTAFANFQKMSEETVEDPENIPAGGLVKAFTFTLAAGSRSKIKWMKAAKNLLVGTRQSEWAIDKETTASMFGGENASALRQSEYGSNGVVAFTGNEIFFVSEDGATVKSLSFDFYNQSFSADEVQTLYNEFPGAPPLDYYIQTQVAREIIQMVWDATRQTLWCLDSAGNWKGLTRIKKAKISLWHSHELGGYDADNRPDISAVDVDHPVSQLVSDGSVVSLGMITDTYTRKSNLWLAVRREINSVWVWTIETMRGGYVHAESSLNQIIATQMIFTDCSKVTKFTAASPTATVAHLTSQQVRATANSVDNGLFTLPLATVTAGVVADSDMHWTDLPNFPGPLDGEYWIAFGYAYRAIVVPVRIEAGSVIGSAQAAIKRIHKAFPRFYKTMAAKVGPDEDRLETLVFRRGSTPMDESAELYTGDKEVVLQSDYDRDGLVYVVQDEPLPFGLTAIILEGLLYD